MFFMTGLPMVSMQGLSVVFLSSKYSSFGFPQGGQVLRLSVSSSVVQGKPVSIHSIRGGRPKPGLQAQHLTGDERPVFVHPVFVHIFSSNPIRLGWDWMKWIEQKSSDENVLDEK